MFFNPVWLLPLILILDSLLGDRPTWPHLVRFVGESISRLEGLLRARFEASGNLRPAGVLLCLLVVGGWSFCSMGRPGPAERRMAPIGPSCWALC